MLEAALPLIEAAGGRCFLLFTSHRALTEGARLLEMRPGFRERYPVLVQGESPRESLLAQFRELGNAVLLGTASFWEGVDVRGHALALVVIDKLPFAAPEDPLLKARLEGIRRRGGNPFQEFQLPQAVLALKQGFGRLIRDREDFGVVMLCDPRIVTRGYGRLFIASLPPAPVVDRRGRGGRIPAAAARARGPRTGPGGRGMKILAIDAATEACSAALLVGAAMTRALRSHRPRPRRTGCCRWRTSCCGRRASRRATSTPSRSAADPAGSPAFASRRASRRASLPAAASPSCP